MGLRISRGASRASRVNRRPKGLGTQPPQSRRQSPAVPRTTTGRAMVWDPRRQPAHRRAGAYPTTREPLTSTSIAFTTRFSGPAPRPASAASAASGTPTATPWPRLRRTSTRPNPSAHKASGATWTTSRSPPPEWIHWFDTDRPHESLDNLTPARSKTHYAHRNDPTKTAVWHTKPSSEAGLGSNPSISAHCSSVVSRDNAVEGNFAAAGGTTPDCNIQPLRRHRQRQRGKIAPDSWWNGDEADVDQAYRERAVAIDGAGALRVRAQ
ncbi:hypothetical protein HEB94_000367 [Actinopolymorpha pittospori]|uniref:Integrase core domain-containing protein n=1 Tax=Actinopolymorpha pittospori TaxID=648752 RepID=A0A927MN05_9ACTN|nr:hypothetical protein [Actinopolymorpha pittospori]